MYSTTILRIAILPTIILSMFFLSCSGPSSPIPYPSIIEILTFYPDRGGYGDTVFIEGKGFGKYREGVTVQFGTAKAEVVSVYPEKIMVRVPASAQAGSTTLTVKTHTATVTASGKFTVEDPGQSRLPDPSPPGVTSVQPLQGGSGDTVRISGFGFGTNIDSIAVVFGPKTATIISVTPEQIIVRVPRNAPAGKCGVIMRIRNRSIFATKSFLVLAKPLMLNIQISELHAEVERWYEYRTYMGVGAKSERSKGSERINFNLSLAICDSEQCSLPDGPDIIRYCCTTQVGVWSHEVKGWIQVDRARRRVIRLDVEFAEIALGLSGYSHNQYHFVVHDVPYIEQGDFYVAEITGTDITGHFYVPKWTTSTIIDNNSDTYRQRTQSEFGSKFIQILDQRADARLRISFPY